MKHRFAVYMLAALVLAPNALAAPARAPTSATSELSAADQAFLSARDAIRIGDRERFAQAAARLNGHPLAPYIEYWQLLGRLRDAQGRRDVGLSRDDCGLGRFQSCHNQLQW